MFWSYNITTLLLQMISMQYNIKCMIILNKTFSIEKHKDFQYKIQ